MTFYLRYFKKAFVWSQSYLRCSKRIKFPFFKYDYFVGNIKHHGCVFGDFVLRMRSLILFYQFILVSCVACMIIINQHYYKWHYNQLMLSFIDTLTETNTEGNDLELLLDLYLGKLPKKKGNKRSCNWSAVTTSTHYNWTHVKMKTARMREKKLKFRNTYRIHSKHDTTN